jgi:hypothetical protein
MRYRNLCRNLFISECNTLSSVINSSSNIGSSSEDNYENDGDEFYSNLLEKSFSENFTDNSIESQCSAERRNTNLAGIQSSSFLK